MRRRRLIWIILGWTLFTFGPLLGVLLAYAVADAGGCPLNESGMQPCVLFGWDAGGLLTGMAVMGWLMLVTLPVGALAALIGSALWLAHRRTTRRRGAGQTPDVQR